ncbi:MAG: G5 domain-containing protein [Abditibacteriota bacterium]|nr:G5 domain-containing protein [Abditibacteriota bacterium]
MKRSVVIALVLLLAAGTVFWVRYRQHCTIYVNGEPCVCLSDRASAESVLNDITVGYAAKYGKQVSIVEKVLLKRGRKAPEKAPEEAKAVLSKRLTPGAECYAVIADGAVVCGFLSRDEAGRFLVYAKERFAPSSGEYEEPEFREKVLIDSTVIDPAIIYDSAEEAFDGVFLNKKPAGGKQYKVKKGDTASAIAVRHGMKLKQLAAANPGYNLNRLKPGDVLNISAGEAPVCLTVEVRQEQTVTESVKPKTVKVSSEVLPYGKTRVLNPGKPGKKKTRYALCYHNGRLVSREIVSEEYLTMPVNRQIAVGIKAAIP